MKTCAKCKIEKSLSEFRQITGSRYYSYCNPCAKTIKNNWRRANPSRISKINRKQTLKKFGGMTEDEYSLILKSQGGGCAICTKTASVKSLAVDHCHKTGKIRGILCSACNTALGSLGDSIEGINRVLDYLKRAYGTN